MRRSKLWHLKSDSSLEIDFDTSLNCLHMYSLVHFSLDNSIIWHEYAIMMNGSATHSLICKFSFLLFYFEKLNNGMVVVGWGMSLSLYFTFVYFFQQKETLNRLKWGWLGKKILLCALPLRTHAFFPLSLLLFSFEEREEFWNGRIKVARMIWFYIWLVVIQIRLDGLYFSGYFFKFECFKNNELLKIQI